MATLTRHPRYHPEDQELDKKLHWSNNLWVLNLFRLYEYIFGRGYGIRAESSSSAKVVDGEVIVEYHFYSFEANIAYAEVIIRSWISVYVSFLKSLISLNPQPQVDYRNVYLTLGIFGLIFHFDTTTKFLPLFGLAITFSGAHTSGNDTTALLIYAHTSTGSNRLLITGAGTDNPGGDTISGATYNSVSETLIDKQANAQTALTHWMFLFHLLAPATGANNVAVTRSSSGAVRSDTVSYSGVKQQVEEAKNKGGNASTTSFGLGVTVITQDAWIIAFSQGFGAIPIAGTGITNRGTEGINCRIGDSNGGLAPGSNTLTWTLGSPDAISAIHAAFAPAAVVQSGGFFIAAAR